MHARKVDALTVKSGPTESGGEIPPKPVGGDVFPVDKVMVFLTNYWPILLLLFIPVGFLLYKKRDSVLRMVARLVLHL